MKTFSILTLGCKVNQYESDQISELLIARGLTPVDPSQADLRIINTCSVTMQAASQSRQMVRRAVRLPVISAPAGAGLIDTASPAYLTDHRRTIVTGCWATSNSSEAAALPGVDAVLGHHDDVAGQLDRLLMQWTRDARQPQPSPPTEANASNWKQEKPLIEAGESTGCIEAISYDTVNEKSSSLYEGAGEAGISAGTAGLPLLGRRQPNRQRAFLKIQDGCDAHCTYCIIPTLRPNLRSKPIEDAVAEARALVEAGHVEIILTGIFLGAYGQSTALRRRQAPGAETSLALLVDHLCWRVPGLRRLRLSSLEPGDLTDDLLSVLSSYEQITPHFHLPLQSGSDLLLRRMNRQYSRDDYLRMVDRLHDAYDRPALTTDVVVGFPGEDDAEFEQTADVVRRAGFIHVHAFGYSPRPGTAAARWTDQFIRGPVVNERIERLAEMSEQQSYAYRQSFIDQEVELIIERDRDASPTRRHGRCERYFMVQVEDSTLRAGDSARVRITNVTKESTFGCVITAKPGDKQDSMMVLQ